MRGRGDFSRNNLDCLRLILASIVVLFHLYALTKLSAFSAFGFVLLPHFAIRSFFVISGFLVYRSYTRSSSVASYFEKRARRIYPAYFTVIVLAAIALCTLSTLPFSQYFGYGFWKYIGANLLFLNFLAPSLPGVFTSGALSAVNGALWTLKIEVGFYLIVPVIHYLCSRFGTNKIIVTIFCLSCIWKFGFAWLAGRGMGPHAFDTFDSTRSIYSQLQVQLPGELLYFCAGIFLLLYFDWLILHLRIIACATAGLFLLDRLFMGGALDVFWISGFVLVFGFWRYFGNFSKFGDFSYGVYIVHYPILQALIVFGAARLNPAIFLLICVTLIGLTAILMWHLVESRFLKSSSHYRQVSQKAPA